MVCECRTGRRDMVILASPEIGCWDHLGGAAEDLGWRADSESNTLRIPLGSDCKFSDPPEVVAFFRTDDNVDISELRAAILPADDDLADHYADLAHADPLETFDDASSTPLLELLDERRLDSWYQPVYTADDLEVWGFECLMRGRDEDGDVVYPDVLLEQAEHEQLQFMLDRVARETHLENAARDVPADAKIMLNFLPTAIYEPEFCLRTTVEVAEKLGLDPNRIVFEVVETEAVEDRDHLIRILEFYRDAGFQVALDDVGAGYSGLAMLADLGPNLIKIDREIVWQIDDSPRHRDICKSIVDLADGDGELVLAEGVEQENHYEFLEEVGVDLLQGFLLNRPAREPVVEPDWRPMA